MSAFKHTPEPWSAHKGGINKIDRSLGPVAEAVHPLATFDPLIWSFDLKRLTEAEQEAWWNRYYEDAERAVSCVNGCKGIVDPEKTVPELVAALVAASRDIVARDIVDQIKYERENPHRPKLPESESLTMIRSVLAKLERGAK